MGWHRPVQLAPSLSQRHTLDGFWLPMPHKRTLRWWLRCKSVCQQINVPPSLYALVLSYTRHLHTLHCLPHTAPQVITIYQELTPDPSFAQPSSKPTVTVITTNGDEEEEDHLVAPTSQRKLLGMKAVVGLAGR